jgi:RNA polymerase sporulation-specific sigma factor
LKWGLCCIKDKKTIDDKDAIDEQVSLKMQIKRLRDVVCKALHGREKTVITMRYGLGPDMTEMTQREIAIKLDISRSYVSRIEKKALARLRKEFPEIQQNCKPK